MRTEFGLVQESGYERVYSLGDSTPFQKISANQGWGRGLVRSAGERALSPGRRWTTRGRCVCKRVVYLVGDTRRLGFGRESVWEKSAQTEKDDYSRGGAKNETALGYGGTSLLIGPPEASDLEYEDGERVRG